ncbi:hypothetical protein [Polyangium jinanense]|uniref:Uncharacterized protein n=1 Tax=Polyangium jinanense TaxID=2829994 RepID=A0A9X3XFM4_9BACT|nr:hypothetical protein [Polyangium jinanense]MDC3960279.1 hypothetical protein [Polyangium jinanense]MDC3988510.1 hypothetical protein [Polyangium jinanense]
MHARTANRFLIVMSALAGAMQLHCVKRDLPLHEIVGSYSLHGEYVGTRVVLKPDHTFVLEWWTCGGTQRVRARWHPLGNGELGVSGVPAPKEPDAGASEPESEGIADICTIDPTACGTIHLDQIRMRVLGDTLELRSSPDPNDVQKLPREP